MSSSHSSLRMLGRSLFSAVPQAGRAGLAARLPAGPRPMRPSAQSPFSGGSSSSRLSSSLAPTSFRREALKPTTIVLIFVPILTGFLGVWQIQRLKWKVALIEEVDKNLAKDPIALPNRINLEYLPEFSFRRVLVRGYFSGPAFLLGPQTKDGIPGYSLICPLVRPNGTTILLNRGFITTTRAKAIREGRELAPGLKPDGTPTKEEVVVEGMLLKPGERSVWTPDNNVEGNEWFWRDVETMAKLAGGEEHNVQPVLVDAVEEGQIPPTLLMQQGMPVGRPAQVELRNQHASYAATWFTLCAATSAMLVFVLRKGKGQPKLKRREL